MKRGWKALDNRKNLAISDNSCQWKEDGKPIRFTTPPPIDFLNCQWKEDGKKTTSAKLIVMLLSGLSMKRGWKASLKSLAGLKTSTICQWKEDGKLISLGSTWVTAYPQTFNEKRMESLTGSFLVTVSAECALSMKRGWKAFTILVAPSGNKTLSVNEKRMERVGGRYRASAPAKVLSIKRGWKAD